MGTVAAAENCKHEDFKTFEAKYQVFQLKNEVSKELISTETTCYKYCFDCKKIFSLTKITSDTNEN